MEKSKLEGYLGKNVSIRLFDGQDASGCLRKTGEKVFEMDPNLYLS